MKPVIGRALLASALITATVAQAPAQVINAHGPNGDDGETLNPFSLSGDPGGPGQSIGVQVNNGALTTFGVDARGGRGGDGAFLIIPNLIPPFLPPILFSGGGDGGNGGNGGTVIVVNNGALTNSGNNAYGLVARSEGGDGGNGGGALLSVVSDPGDGGVGGSGGSVTATNNGIISTSGTGSYGIFARSAGGRGGNGGESIVGIIQTGGGNGGAASQGGPVSVSHLGGSITTNGLAAHGILAQSVGGGGGDEGGSFLTLARIGGSAAPGNNGNSVTVTSNSLIETFGENSYGVLAQSVGGGGGDGGASVSLIAIGGDGAGGGTGGPVTVNAGGTIRTHNVGSIGILAESIGGGGGNGGFTVGVASIGGAGSGGGNASSVSVRSAASPLSITTDSDKATGIIAQSVGGGGGNGGLALSAGTVNISVGGNGGVGGNGDLVTFNVASGAITTFGSDAGGVIAQSIGGGGGNGGLAGGVSGIVGVNIGGQGNAAGNGAIVNLTSGLTIDTEGDRSIGLLAQSIGGGGGNGGGSAGFAAVAAINVGGAGGAGGNASDVTAVNHGAITTDGVESHGLSAQSIGGGGGNGGFAIGVSTGVTVSIGGSGAGGGTAGTVSVTNDNTIGTLGDKAHGILAQSIGGGGGSGGTAGSLAVGVFSGAIAVGGSGGDGNFGSTVTVNNTASITTEGNGARGIMAQSIGGGGGTGGDAFAANVSFPIIIIPVSAGASVAVGGEGGNGSDGGVVTVNHHGSITTTGDFGANAILAQSVGGGGGNGGRSIAASIGIMSTVNVAVAVGGAGGDGGIGRAVTVNATPDATFGNLISTDGALSAGIVAQSIGGSGGNGGSALAISGGVSAVATPTINASVSVGGGGGSGGSSGAVTVTNSLGVDTDGVSSAAIIAQSIGGGGGTGGSATSSSIQIGQSSSLTLSANVSVGGGGGTGNTAGTVTVTNSGTLTTSNDLSAGIYAQSIGGGGGFGGSSDSNALLSTGGSNSYQADVSFGGTGGSGAHSNVVTVTNSGVIVTSGFRSDGIAAMSIGGGGGGGGLANAGADANALADVNGSIAFGLGGKGGASGNAFDPLSGSTLSVKVSNSNFILTTGDFSSGINAASIGGGGGIGGAATTGTSGTYAIGASIAGAGSGGGDGGDVIVDNIGGIIITTGIGSHGIIAESIGGGGGQGGAGQATGSGGTLSIDVGLGGRGGVAGDGGDVTVTTANGGITTTDIFAAGILAQSIGGGGGIGGSGGTANGGADYSVSFSMGGSGGAGGDGGIVTVNNGANHTITTTGDLSAGIFAQSVGGGGGAGGGALKASGDGGGSLDIGGGLGGAGGAAGSGQAVTVTNAATGRIETSGVSAHGIFAQSVGGGGGFGGASSGASANSEIAIVATIGGAGGDGGGSSLVTVTNDGEIVTGGLGAHGIFAQAIGGGGGASGGATGNLSSQVNIGGGFGGVAGGGGTAGDVVVTNNGLIQTSEAGAIGVVAQSVGGGGGFGGIAANATSGSGGAINVGGFGGDGGNGGDVTVTVTGTIITSGAQAHGVFAQSVGGGGGFGGGGSASGTVGLAIGGAGGDGGNGGDVTVIRTGQIITQGADSIAIVVQSVGGGGGFGGSGVARFDANAAPVPGLFKGTQGVGGVVTVTQLTDSDVLTLGARSHGLFVQGVGGGGGAGGFGSNSGAGSGGGAGDAREAGAVAMSDVRALGESAYAIFAQSAAGQDSASAVTIDVQKVARSTGLNSVAIYGESTGQGGQGNIAMTIANNVVWGGGGPGAGVVFVGGVDNDLASDGTIIGGGLSNAFVPGVGPLNVTGIAIQGGVGSEVIQNSRNVMGNVVLGGGTNAFNNQVSALFITDAQIGLTATNAPLPPAANLLTNAGTLDVGGVDIVKTTNLSGNLILTSSSVYPIDVNLDGQVTDRLNVTGTAAVDGVGPLLFQNIDKKFNEYILIATQGGVTDNGFTPTMDVPTVGFEFLVKVEDDDLILFAEKPPLGGLITAAGGDPNMIAMGKGLDNIEAVLGTDDPFNRLINLLRFQPDLDALGDAVATLTPTAAPHVLETARRRAAAFMDQMATCPVYSLIDTQSRNGCVWASGTYAEYDRDSVERSPVIEDEYRALTLGLRAPLDPNWTIGTGFEVGAADSDVTRKGIRLSDTETDVRQASLSADYRSGGYGIGLNVAGANNAFKTTRHIKIDGFQQNYTTFDGILDTSATNFATDELPIFTDRTRIFDGISGDAVGESDLWSINAQLRMSYTVQNAAGFHVMPFVDLNAHFSRIDAYTETGVDLANLTYPSVSDTLFTVTPGVELGLTTQTGHSSWLQAYIRGGVIVATDDEWKVKTQFDAAPGGVPDITLIESIDTATAKVDAGLRLLDASGLEVSVDYGGQFSKSVTEQEVKGSVKYRW